MPESLRPLSILCELTYRCNLACPYCSNPIEFARYRNELSTDDWQRVLAEAAALGVVQAHFSGGEPTLRRDLVELVAHAVQLGLYANLITQGTFLDEKRLDDLLAAGLDHIQVSVQAPSEALADEIAGTNVHARKLDALERIARRDVALTLNCVLHRRNHDELEATIALAERLGIARLELANVQFYGWAYKNRAGLMPTPEQVLRGSEIISAARERLRGRMEIVYVAADHFGDYPKPCMNGWGREFLTVTPDGRVLPCPAATSIRTLSFESVRERSLSSIWTESPAFTAYRGTAWMAEPCRSCERRERDWGGCRCQAFLLTGNAATTDPACSLSPDHSLIVEAREPKDEPLVARR